jgi:nicotinamidase-related amidase
MPTIPNRPHTALLVIDVQNDVVARAHDRDQVVATIGVLVDRARTAGIPVIWIQQTDEDLPSDSDGWRIVAELSPAAGDPIVSKQFGDAFEATDLEARLDRFGVGHLVVSGAQTDQCVRCTIHGAFTRGYDVTLVADAHTTEDATQWGAPPPEQVIAHTNLYWRYQSAPGRSARAVATRDIDW